MDERPAAEVIIPTIQQFLGHCPQSSDVTSLDQPHESKPRRTSLIGMEPRFGETSYSEVYLESSTEENEGMFPKFFEDYVPMLSLL